MGLDQKSSRKKIKGYQKRFEKYGVDPRALQWQSKKAQEIRLKELVADVNFEGKSILDVGCGFGDLSPFISGKTKNFKYTGVDIVPEFIEAAKLKYPKHKFLVRDYFANPLKKYFDIIVSSGTLNANIKSPYEYRKKAVKNMFSHANEAVVFNMAGGHPQPINKRGNRVYYADSLTILEYCFTLTPKVIFRQAYHPRDFTVALVK